MSELCMSEYLKAIKWPTKYIEMISTTRHGVRLALLIPKLFLAALSSS